MLEFLTLFMSILGLVLSLFAFLFSAAACVETTKSRKQLEKLEARARELITLTGRLAREGGDTSQRSGGGIDPRILQ
jgi:hypothetical protein